MARISPSFSRSLAAVAATCVLSAAVVVPAHAAGALSDEELSAAGITVTAFAEAQTVEPAAASFAISPAAVPEEPGQTLAETPVETVADDSTAGSDGSTDGTGGTDGGSGSDGSVDDNEAEGGVDGGADADGGGIAPVETEEPVLPPTLEPGTDFPVEPVEPLPGDVVETVVPVEPGHAEDEPEADDGAGLSSDASNAGASVSPEEGAVQPAADLSGDQSSEPATEVLAETGADGLLITLGVGALLALSGLAMVLPRLRSRTR